MGTRTYAPWSITVINDENFLVRRAFEYWLQSMNGNSSNFKENGVTSIPSSYQTDALVMQYSQGPRPEPIATYKFINIFPTEASIIELGWDGVDAIEEFSVTFRYDYWTTEANS